MVAQFLRLRLAAQASSFRRGGWHGLGVVLVLLYTIAATVLVCGALAGARAAAPSAPTRDILVVVGSCVALLYIAIPLLVRHDGTLDPRSFAILGLDARTTALGVGAASFISVPALVLAVCSLFTVVTWSEHPGAAVLAFVAAVVAVPTWILAARLATSAASHYLVGRRARQWAGALTTFLAVVIVIAVGLGFDGVDDGLGVLHSVASILGWTPLGAVWAVGGDAASGQWSHAVFALLIALATLAAVAFGWLAWVAHVIVAPQRRAASREHVRLGWFSALPSTPAGAIAARSLTYWGRDSRYWVQLALVPVFPFVMVAALAVSGAVDPRMLALIPLPVVCLFLGWIAHNDVAYDGTAIWLQTASGTRGISDRIGRLAPVALIAVPVVLVGTVLTVLAYGDGAVLPAVVGVSVCLVLTGMGLSSISSALVPYPAPRPGDSAFAHPSRTGASAAIAQVTTMVLAVIFAAVPATMTVLGALGEPSWFPLALASGVGIGVVVLVGGVWLGALTYDHRGPELMAFALRNA